MKPSLCIIAEGGGTKIAYTCGVLKCLLEYGIEADRCIGISAGSSALIAFIARQPERLYTLGVEATSRRQTVGLIPLLKERSIFGLNSSIQFIDRQAPLDYETFQNSPTQLDTGIYNIATHKVDYYDKSWVKPDNELVRTACALLMLSPAHTFNHQKYIDGGLLDMISIEQGLKYNYDKYLIISTKEEGYERRDAPAWQLEMVKRVYKDPVITEHYRQRKANYDRQWALCQEQVELGRALILRPGRNMGITRYTTDRRLLEPWFELGYMETRARMSEIQAFLKEPVVQVEVEEETDAGKIS